MTSINSFKVNENYLKHYSTFNILSKPSFLTGIGSLLNVYGNHYRFKTFPRPTMADRTAIENDWGVIGKDILESIDRVDK